MLDPALESSGKICTTRPTIVTRSSTFIVNLSKLAHPDDIKRDNYGIWNHSGSHPQQYMVEIKKGGYVSVEKCYPGARGDNVVHLRKLHSVHPSNKSFERMIAFLSGM